MPQEYLQQSRLGISSCKVGHEWGPPIRVSYQELLKAVFLVKYYAQVQDDSTFKLELAREIKGCLKPWKSPKATASSTGTFLGFSPLMDKGPALLFKYG